MSYETDPVTRDGLADSTNTAILVDTRFGHIAGYLPSAAVYRCPADQSYVILEDGKHSRVRSYSMNWFVGNHGDSLLPFSAWTFFQRTTDFVNVGAEAIVALIDEHDDAIIGGDYSAADPVLEGYGFGRSAPASRHGRSTPLSFSDGHVEIHRWGDSRTLLPVKRAYFTGAKFDSANPDCDWLFDHSAKRLHPTGP